MKKLLFITAFPPNNKSGGQAFSLNLLKDLSKTYLVDLVYFAYKNHSIDESLSVNSITSFDIDNLNCLRNVTKHPIFTRRFDKNVLRYLLDITAWYDIIFFDFTQVGLYSLYLQHPYKVIRCHDILYQKFSRKHTIFKHWITLTEKKILQSVNKIFVPSEQDAAKIKSVYNLDAYFTHEYLKEFTCYDFVKNERQFVFYGLWSRSENTDGLIWFFKNVYPRFDTCAAISFTVIGGGLPEKIRCKYLLPNNIKYFGFVDDPLKIIYDSCALIAPLFSGAGVKVKVIDAFTTGTPVIGTDIAFEGLPFVENLVYRAHKPREYANFINNFPILSATEKQKNVDAFRSFYDNNHLPEKL